MGWKIYNTKTPGCKFHSSLIMNAISRKYGRKDMIKIENVIDLDLAMLGFIDPKIQLIS